MAILPSECIDRIVSNLVPYIESSCVPVEMTFNEQSLQDYDGLASYRIPSIRWQLYRPSFRPATQSNNSCRFLRLAWAPWERTQIIHLFRSLMDFLRPALDHLVV